VRDLPGFRITEILYEDEYCFRCRACREADDRLVLLKVVRNASTADRAGLKHEYEIAADFGSPWIKQPLELENFDDAVVLVAADEGEKPLRQILRDGPLPMRQTLRIAADLAAALVDLHRADIVHKNVQPDSVFLGADAGIKFVDFAIASRLASDQTAIDGPLEGALPYISPEQTGRMNRALDHRTDFYSLGVTLYEMLTGRLPFSADDAVAWVHCHIAVPPLPPDQINSQVPTAVSALVLKLLDKTAEERYQSASGLQSDLDECLERFERGDLADFVPGRHDVGDRFQVSQQLYGRESEVSELLETFNRVAQGESATVLIAGCSGAGKSALVNEIHKPIVYQRGYFTAGKFEQYKRNIPYSALIQAFAALVRQLLAESSDRVAFWKERLDAVLGKNGEIIVDVIPDIELIIGPQPPVSSLPPAEAQNRFNMVFCDFVRVFAGPDNPLVIFLDDLQWADSASRQLIHLLTTDAATRHLLLLGAYREEDLSSAHPLALLLNEMRQDRVALSTISLGLLDPSHIGQLVADTLDAAADEVAPLADLIHRKTEGNPFFVYQLLMHLHQDGLIAFAADTASWIWDLGEIQALHLTDDLAQLMADKLREQSSAARQILQLAACIGAEFDLATLVTVAEKEPGQVLADLRQPLSEGLVLPLGDAYKYMHSDAADEAHLLDGLDLSFRFPHDQMQQAAYELIPGAEEERVRYRIGRLLLDAAPPDALEEQIFTIINHLNFGCELIADADEKRELARLNLVAGRRAKAATAYHSALEYFQIGVDLLPANAWQAHYQLCFDLHFERYEATYLISDFERVETLFCELLDQTRERSEKARLYNIRLMMYATQGHHRDACDVGIAGLRLFGIDLSPSPSRVAVMGELLRVKRRLLGKRVPDLIDLPEMRDADRRVAMSFLSNLTGTSYQADLNLFAVVVLRMVHMSLKYGNTHMAAHGYGLYGAMLCGFLNDFARGYEFGQLGLELAEKYDDISAISRSYFDMAAFVSHWRRPLEHNIPLLDRAFQAGLDAGDFYAACYCASNKPFQLLLGAASLDDVLVEIEKSAEFVQRAGYEEGLEFIAIYRQFTRCLRGEIDAPGSFADDEYDEDRRVANLRQRQNKLPLHWYSILKMAALYLFGSYREAVRLGDEAADLISFSAAFPYVAVHVYFRALSLTAAYPSADEATKKRYWKELKGHRKKLRLWARNCPDNFLHFDLLVRAEMANIDGREEAAIQHYEDALQAARTNRGAHYEAITAECAARFLIAQGHDQKAAERIDEARRAYARWGATAKVCVLEREYARYLASVERQDAAGIDLVTVIRASQALSGEIVLRRLLEKFMGIILQNAGAQKGFLIREIGGGLVVAAEATIDDDQVILSDKPLAEAEGLARAIVNYVARTREPVVLSDAAAEGTFAADPYIAHHQPRSVLCTPLLHQGQLSGILYLENNLATGAFTPDRLEVLELLSAQAATSLENAQLYETLEERVAERTRELEQTHRELQETQNKFIAELESELQTAHNIQMGLLPARSPDWEKAVVAGYCRPATHVGGDLYHFLDATGTNIASVADVTGHGMEAAVPVMMYDGILRTEIHYDSNNGLIERLNERLKAIFERRTFLCLSMVSIDDQGKKVRVTNAGLPYPLHYKKADGTVEPIAIDALPLGLRPNSTYVWNTVEVEGGDRIIMYSDGLIEVEDLDENIYGSDRFEDAVLRACQAGGKPREIIDSVYASVSSFDAAPEQVDDQTMVVIEIV